MTERQWSEDRLTRKHGANAENQLVMQLRSPGHPWVGNPQQANLFEYLHRFLLAKRAWRNSMS